MKKILTVFLALALVLSLCCCSRDDVGEKDNGTEAKPPVGTEQSYTIGGVEVKPVAYGGPTLSFEYNVDIHFKFAVRTDHLSSLLQTDPYFKVEGKYAKGDSISYESGTSVELGEPTVVNIDGVEHRVYDVVVMGLTREYFYENYSAMLYLSFKTGGVNYCIPAGEAPVCANVFTSALGEYNDRSNMPGDGYTNRLPDGTYSKVEDITSYDSVLNSIIVLETDGAMKVRDLSESEYFVSVYEVEYFDGVLTIGMKNGSPVSEQLLSSIIINGEYTYFEIENGKITLAVNY